MLISAFRSGRLKNNQTKKPKKGGDKSAVAIVKVKDARQLGCVLQDVEPPESSAIARKGTRVLESSRRVRFTRAALRQANIREKEGPSLGKMQVTILHQRSTHAAKVVDRTQEETERQERCARGDAWRLAKNICKKRKKLHSIRFPMSGFAGRIHNKAGGTRVCGGLRSKHAHGQQERPIEKSDNGSDSQRRNANKRRGNGFRARIGFIRDGNAS